MAALKIKNKYKHQARARRRILRKIIVNAFSLIIIFGGATYLLFFSPFLKVRGIEVDCLPQTSVKCGSLELINKVKKPIEEVINENIFGLVKKNNFLFIHKNEIQALILIKNPQIESLSIEKIFLDNVIKISFSPRKSEAIFCRIEYLNVSNDKNTLSDSDAVENCFYIDKNGIAFEAAPNTSGSLILVIKQAGSGKINLGDEVVPQSLVSFFQEFRENFKNMLAVSFKEFQIVSDSIFTYVNAKTNEGWEIYVMPQDDTEKLARILNAIFTQDIKEGRGLLQYVDLRLKNKVYYKLRGDEIEDLEKTE